MRNWFGKFWTKSGKSFGSELLKTVVPLVVLASIWATISTWSRWSFVTWMGNFGIAWIFLGSLFSYLNRAWKQSQDKVRHEDVLDKLENAAKQIAGFTTGGDSFAYIYRAGISADDVLQELYVSVRGGYPLYEMTVRLIDISEVDKKAAEAARSKPELDAALARGVKCHHQFQSALVAGIMYPVDLTIPLRRSGTNAFHVHWYGRNGLTYERLETIRIGDRWVSASSVSRGDLELHSHVEAGFPTNEDGTACFSHPLPCKQLPPAK